MKNPNFSRRMGMKPLAPMLKPGQLSKDAKIRIWNHLVQILHKLRSAEDDFGQREDIPFLREIWTEHLKRRLDYFSPQKAADACCDILLGRNKKTYHILDFIEFTINESSLPELLKKIAVDQVSLILEEENSPFRIYDGRFILIHSALEAESLETALNASSSAVNKHLKAAAEMLQSKTEGNIRNSIKESISAVAAAFHFICGENANSIDKYIQICEKKRIPIQLHKCFRDGLGKFYSWTSGKQGMRHEITDEQTKATYADAQFMLHICSAAINMLLRSGQHRTKE